MAQRSLRAASTAPADTARNSPSEYTAVRKNDAGKQHSSHTPSRAGAAPSSISPSRCIAASPSQAATNDTTTPPTIPRASSG